MRDDRERQLWLMLDHSYMTDESEYEEENGDTIVHQHFLPWRSQGLANNILVIIKFFLLALNKFVRRLQKRMPPSIRKKVASAPSMLLPPVDAPKWAIDLELVMPLLCGSYFINTLFVSQSISMAKGHSDIDRYIFSLHCTCMLYDHF